MRIKNPIAIDGARKYAGPPVVKTFQMLRRHTSPVLSRYHDLWNELHSGQITTQDQFDNWLERLPNKDCDCRAWVKEHIANNPPRFSDMPKYGWELHNAVNRKLSKRDFSWWEFAIRYDLDLPIQPETSSIIAVTSFAPDRLERQTVCLDSWVKLGLRVVSVNSQSEIDSMKDGYPQVSKWIATEFEKTPNINSLIDVAVSESSPILIVNSDIEIYGDQDRLAKLIQDRKNAVGVRHNYETRPSESNQEQWGVDAFIVYPEQAPLINRADFRIGVPMWDWWLPWEIDRIGGDCEWIDEPYFFHKSHDVAWDQATCNEKKNYFAKRFGFVDFIKWRRNKSFEGCFAT